MLATVWHRQASGIPFGGGFRYYKLAPSLLELDEFGNWVISKEYNAAMLPCAEAICKLEGLRTPKRDYLTGSMDNRPSQTSSM